MCTNFQIDCSKTPQKCVSLKKIISPKKCIFQKKFYPEKWVFPENCLFIKKSLSPEKRVSRFSINTINIWVKETVLSIPNNFYHVKFANIWWKLSSAKKLRKVYHSAIILIKTAWIVKKILHVINICKWQKKS